MCIVSNCIWKYITYTNPIFLEHDTGFHPENANRLRSIDEKLKLDGFIVFCNADIFLDETIKHLQYTGDIFIKEKKKSKNKQTHIYKQTHMNYT